MRLLWAAFKSFILTALSVVVMGMAEPFAWVAIKLSKLAFWLASHAGDPHDR